MIIFLKIQNPGTRWSPTQCRGISACYEATLASDMGQALSGSKIVCRAAFFGKYTLLRTAASRRFALVVSLTFGFLPKRKFHRWQSLIGQSLAPATSLASPQPFTQCRRMVRRADSVAPIGFRPSLQG
jgi:hypothetical protein